MYDPGEGITPHVDLLGRYGDGIIGVSLGSGCVMRFDSTEDPSLVHELYLPSRSILVLSGDARYKWTHGIDKRMKDYVVSDNDVSSAWHERGRRISITLRWLLPGADVVGDAGESLGSEEPANF
jgi:alkylated DNA repair dioxygenase AlkB